MKTLALVAALAFSGSAMADVLLLVDLSITDTITISATDGLSAVTTDGSDTTGVYFADFWGGDGSITSTLVFGDLTNAENPADNSPLLYRADPTDPGLNIWSWSSDSTVTFTAGSLAFVGSATWDVDSVTYANMLAGGISGNLYFPADSVDDIPNARILGEWSLIPAPGALALLGLAGFATRRRRR